MVKCAKQILCLELLHLNSAVKLLLLNNVIFVRFLKYSWLLLNSYSFEVVSFDRTLMIQLLPVFSVKKSCVWLSMVFLQFWKGCCCDVFRTELHGWWV